MLLGPAHGLVEKVRNEPLVGSQITNSRHLPGSAPPTECIKKKKLITCRLHFSYTEKVMLYTLIIAFHLTSGEVGKSTV